MKKLICILLCAVMMFGAVGCTQSDEDTFLPAPMTPARGEPLSAQEYKQTLRDIFRAYVDLGSGLTDALKDRDNVKTMAQLKPISEKVEPIFADMDAVMCKHYEIVPPAEYEQLHEKLLTAVENERLYIMYMRRSFASKTKSNMDKNIDKATELSDSANESGTSYAKVVLEIIQKMKEDGVE